MLDQMSRKNPIVLNFQLREHAFTISLISVFLIMLRASTSHLPN